MTAIELSFLVFGPVVLALLTLLGFAYPIRGERLARLKAQVAVLNEDRSRRITERNVSRPASTRGTASTRTLAEVVFRSRGSRPDEVALSEQLTTSSVPYSEPASEAGGAAASAEAASAEAPMSRERVSGTRRCSRQVRPCPSCRTCRTPVSAGGKSSLRI